MQVGLRCGARLIGVKAEMACAVPLIMEIFRDHQHPFFITSTTDGTHSANSLHRFGMAIDIDFQQDRFTPAEGEWIVEDIKAALGPDYDVVFEYNHIHVEYDPEKQPIVQVAE